MKRLFDILDWVLETLLFAALAGMVTVVAAGVFWRYMLKDPISWADELAAILMVWFTFLGAAVGMRDQAHYAFDYLVRSLPRRAGKFVTLFGQFLAIAISAGLLYWSAEVAFRLRHWVMPALEVSRALVYSACPVGTFFILMYALRHFHRELTGKSPVVAESAAEESAL